MNNDFPTIFFKPLGCKCGLFRKFFGNFFEELHNSFSFQYVLAIRKTPIVYMVYFNYERKETGLFLSIFSFSSPFSFFLYFLSLFPQNEKRNEKEVEILFLFPFKKGKDEEKEWEFFLLFLGEREEEEEKEKKELPGEGSSEGFIRWEVLGRQSIERRWRERICSN